jgi:hypothetical protein
MALPIWLVVFIVLYALATLYVARCLAGAFFVSSGRESTRHLRLAPWPPVMRKVNSSGMVFACTPAILAPPFEKSTRTDVRVNVP